MRGIPIYAADATDFGTNGLGLLYPISCQVQGTISSLYELTIEMPIVAGDKFELLQPERIIKASAPVPNAPVIQQSADSEDPEPSSGEIWRIISGCRVNLRQGPGTGYQILGVYGPAEMLVLEKTTPYWYHVQMLDGGAIGYMSAQYLEYSRPAGGGGGGGGGGSEDVVAEISRTQLFRIYSVDADTSQGTVIARALHIFYDLRGNLLDGEYEPNNVAAATAIQTAFSRLTDSHAFALYIGNITGTVSGNYSYRSFVDILLNDSDGILKQIDAHLLRDNFNIYIVPNQTVDRGVQIKRGKNLSGLAVSHDTSEVVTRIIPVGQTSDGEPLYIDDGHVDSAHIDEYPFIRTVRVAYDVKVDRDGDYPTESDAKAALEEKAQAEYDEHHVDEPTYGMQVDFVMLENTEQYSQYAKLQKIFLYDSVRVIDRVIGVDRKLNVTEFVWNVLLERYDTITVGEIPDDEMSGYTAGTSLSGTGSGMRISSVARELMSLTSGNNDSVMYQALAHALDLARASISAGTTSSDVLATAILALRDVLIVQGGE